MGCTIFIIKYIEIVVDTNFEYFEAHRGVKTMFYLIHKYESWYITTDDMGGFLLI